MSDSGYSSIEDFYAKEKRYPNHDEILSLYSRLWDEYLQPLSDEEQRVATENQTFSATGDQQSILQRIPQSASRLRKILSACSVVMDVNYYEYWGDYRLCVRASASDQNHLAALREFVPNFFEGWYVELAYSSKLRRLIHSVKLNLAPRDAEQRKQQVAASLPVKIRHVIIRILAGVVGSLFLVFTLFSWVYNLTSGDETYNSVGMDVVGFVLGVFFLMAAFSKRAFDWMRRNL